MNYQDLSDKTFCNLIFTKEDRLDIDYVEEAKIRKQTMVPFLCEVLQKKENYDGEDERGWGVIHAAYILGILADERSLPAFLTASRYADAYDIDWLYEALGECYVRIGPAAIPALKVRILEEHDPEEDSASLFELDGLWNIWGKYPETRQDIEAFFMTIIASAGKYYEIKSHLIADFAGLKRHDLRPLFEKLLDAGEYDPITISRADLDYFYNSDSPDHQPGFRKDLEAFYSREEIDARQQRWEEEDAKEEERLMKEEIINRFSHTGRNDPCPCGSGKKYKKCHLQAVEEEMARRRAEEAREEDATATGAVIWQEREYETMLRRLLAAKDRTGLFPDLKAKAIEAMTAPQAELMGKGLQGYFEPLFAQIGFSNTQETDSFRELFFAYYSVLASQYKDHPRDKGNIQ